MSNKKSLSLTISLLIFGTLTITSMAMGDLETWKYGYRHGNIIYSEFLHKMKPHGASTVVYGGENHSDPSVERICARRGQWARSEQEDSYRHSENHGHAYKHICDSSINCNGYNGIFDE